MTSLLTNIDVPVISDHIGAEGGRQAEAGQQEGHQPRVTSGVAPGARPHPLTSGISASRIWNEMKINDGICLFRTECEVKTAAGEK